MLNPAGQCVGKSNRRFSLGTAERAGGGLASTQHSQRFGLFHRRCHLIHDRHRNSTLDLLGEAGEWRPTENNDVRLVLGHCSVGKLNQQFGGQIADVWRERGGQPNTVFRTLFGIAAIVATISIFSVAYVKDAVIVVALLSSTLFFLRWCGMYWAIPSILATRNRAGFLGGCMNLGGNIAGVTVPIIVGFIVQFTGSYYLALMFFAAAGVALLVCSTAIDYSRKLPV